MPLEPVLVLDSPDQSVLPLHFRKADSPFVKPGSPIPTRAGLNKVRASGSHQFSEEELGVLVQALPSGTLVVDLRQESHGFINGTAVSWFSPKDFANVGMPPEWIKTDETLRLEALMQAGTATMLEVTAKDSKGGIAASTPRQITVSSVSTEERLVRSMGLNYARIPVRDHSRPSNKDADQFLDIWRNMPPEGWLHLHCHAGEGRTTAFMAMADMLVNAREVGFEDIMRRQGMLGGLNLLEPLHGWKRPYSLRRREFLRRFHAYASANPGGRPITWSRWLRNQKRTP